MPAPCPELLFLSGPQEGQRAVLLKNVSFAGRSETCDVHIAEEFVSRQHLRFENTPDGCLMEVLSPHGVRVNGKAYKPPKKILLDTGDRLLVGAVTELLFVAAEDDPAEALAAYRKARPSAAAPPPRAEKEKPPEPPPEEAPKEEPQALVLPLPPARREELRKAEARRAKLRKYVILGSVYGAVLLALFIFVLPHLRRENAVASGPPGLVSKDYEKAIEDAVKEPLRRTLSENIGAEELRKAQALFDSRKFRRGNLQKCIKGFKLHLAYLNKPDFDDPDNSRMYAVARDELILQVKEVYKEAWFREKARQWPAANQKWEELREILADDDGGWNSPAYKKLVDNIMAHAAYTRSNMPKGR